MAYLRDLVRQKCANCNKTASVQLMGSRNEDLRVYCALCGRRALADRVMKEEQWARTKRDEVAG